jgi:SAM-dependent methyltransferase
LELHSDTRVRVLRSFVLPRCHVEKLRKGTQGKGTQATKDFYDRIGWRRDGAQLVDSRLFAWTDGPTCRALVEQRNARILDAVGGPGLRLAELGCGGTPAVFLAARCSSYTAVDFSRTGLREAALALEAAKVPFETVEADITDLPFADGSFDVVYSAHAVYHIATAEGQAAAFDEAMRVLAPGGRAVFVLANPLPLLFPYRLIRRVLATTPGVGTLLNRLRPKPPLPYLPMPLGWIRRRLSRWGDVRTTGHAVPSVAFDRLVSERTTLGVLAWRGIERLETRHRGLAARLGCYVLVVATKSASFPQ